MDKSTRHLPARLAPLFHGVGTIIHETGRELAWPPRHDKNDARDGVGASAARGGASRARRTPCRRADVRDMSRPSSERDICPMWSQDDLRAMCGTREGVPELSRADPGATADVRVSSTSKRQQHPRGNRGRLVSKV